LFIILCSRHFSYKKSLLFRFPASCFVSFPQLLPSPPHYLFPLYPLLFPSLFLFTYSHSKNSDTSIQCTTTSRKNLTLLSLLCRSEPPGISKKPHFDIWVLPFAPFGYSQTHFSFAGFLVAGRGRWGPVAAKPGHRRRLRGVSGRVDLRGTEVSHLIVWERRLDLVTLIVTTR